ncbi:MAG: type II transport protein GspH [SAR86 cluster bacterium]|uniref:Type II secretion system protein H n=1 Tax=SAR86 cluster bacterium TaxID=2030880 RepID=A0A972VZI1_9GAMM|nr:type II transport protein GspH [SAR86 cluster bacterium]
MRLSMYGMTLIELVLVVALIGIGILVAAPSFNSILSKNQTTTQINELVTAINLARSEASKVSGVVSLQAANAINNVINNDNEFGNGWCVVVGNPGDCTGDVIRSFPAPLGVDTINSENDSLQFNAFGALNDNSTRTFIFCSPGKDRLITITPVGRSKIDNVAPGDC